MGGDDWGEDGVYGGDRIGVGVWDCCCLWGETGSNDRVEVRQCGGFRTRLLQEPCDKLLSAIDSHSAHPRPLLLLINKKNHSLQTNHRLCDIIALKVCSLISFVFFLKDVGVIRWIAKKLSITFDSTQIGKTSLVVEPSVVGDDRLANDLRENYGRHVNFVESKHIE